MKSRNGKVKGPGRKRGVGHKDHCSQSGGVSGVEDPVCTGAGVVSEPSRNPIDHVPPVNSAPMFLGGKMLALGDAEQGERKQATILVADVPDYSFSSSDLDQEEAYKIMARCLAIMGEQIRHYGGTMTQVTRGVVKGVFGAPVSHEDHAKRACEAALSIMKLVSSYRERIRKEGDLDFEIRIGLASGTILTQSLSSGTDLDDRDLDSVDDLILMIKGITKPSKIVASRTTHDLVSDFFEFQQMDQGGREVDRPVEGYELVRSRELASPIRAREMRRLSKFVGREQEMFVLLRSAEKARQGRGQVVVITGDAGVGKSRLALEFKRLLPEESAYLEGYCRNYNGVPPYHPLLDILKSIFGIQSGEREDSVKEKIRHRLSRLVPTREDILAPLHEIFALKVSDQQYLELPFQEKKNRIFQAIETVLVEASQEKLLVVIVEDLHWIDHSSEEILNYLMGRIENAKILLILLYRPEYVGAPSLRASTREVRLEHIASEHVKELAEFVLGGHGLSDGLSRLILEKTGGNPLFVEELTRSLADGGAIQKSNGKFILAHDAAPEVLPKTIQAVISARMDRLEKDVKATLQIASVLGKEFPLALLERVSGDGKNIKSHISRLRELEFIYEEKDQPQRQLAFKHVLTQEAAYGSLLTRRKQQIHKETGRVIEGLFADRLDEFYEPLAYHFGKSGNFRKEFKYLKLSAIKAQRQNSPWEALSFADRALRSMKKQPATRESKKREIEVLIVINWVVRMLDYASKETEQFLKRGEELSLDVGDEKSLSIFKAALGIYYLATGNANSFRQYSDQLLGDSQAIENTEFTKDQLRIIGPIALDHSMSGLLTARFSNALKVNLRILQRMEEVHALFESYDMPFNAYSFLTAMSAGFSSWLGDFDNAMVLCRKALSISLKTKSLDSKGQAELYYGIVLSNRGCGEEAIDHLTKSIEYFGKAKVGVAFSASSWAVLGYSDFLVGDLDGARQCMEKALQMQLDSGLLFYLAYIYCNLSMVHLASQDLTNAQSCIYSALEWSQKCNEKHWEGLAKIFFGKILTESEALQAARAEASILEGIQILTKLEMRPLCAQGYFHLGEHYLHSGRTELGVKNLKKAARMFKQMGMEYWVRKTQDVLDHFQKSLR